MRNIHCAWITTAFILFACGCARDEETPAPSTSTPDALQSAAEISPLRQESKQDSKPESKADDEEHPLTDENTPGRTFYVSQEGSGRQDGSDWKNAAAAASLQSLLSEEVRPGDRIVLGSGRFPKFSVTRGGLADRPLTIAGVDTGEGLPAIEGRWQETKPAYHAHSWSGISVAEGVSHVRIGGLQISGFIYGVKATNNRDVQWFQLSITRCREGLSFVGLKDSTIRDCRIVRYTKRGIRFKEGCHDLIVADVVADATSGLETWPTEAFPFGFAIEDGDGNHSIRFERCTARNNVFPSEPGKYWNGDGFLAENNAENLSYVDCASFGNSDGGWDDKSRSPRLIGCVAARNKRGFRIWNVRGDHEHPARLENCLGVYNKSAGGSGSSAGLWLCGVVEAERCTFHNNATAAIVIENNGPGGKLWAVNCILSAGATTPDKPLVLEESGTTYEADGVVQWPAGNPDEEPRYKAPSPQWDGTPLDAFNSRRYGNAKGFWHASSVPHD